MQVTCWHCPWLLLAGWLVIGATGSLWASCPTAGSWAMPRPGQPCGPPCLPPQLSLLCSRRVHFERTQTLPTQGRQGGRRPPRRRHSLPRSFLRYLPCWSAPPAVPVHVCGVHEGPRQPGGLHRPPSFCTSPPASRAARGPQHRPQQAQGQGQERTWDLLLLHCRFQSGSMLGCGLLVPPVLLGQGWRGCPARGSCSFLHKLPLNAAKPVAAPQPTAPPSPLLQPCECSAPQALPVTITNEAPPRCPPDPDATNSDSHTACLLTCPTSPAVPGRWLTLAPCGCQTVRPGLQGPAMVLRPGLEDVVRSCGSQEVLVAWARGVWGLAAACLPPDHRACLVLPGACLPSSGAPRTGSASARRAMLRSDGSGRACATAACATGS